MSIAKEGIMQPKESVHHRADSIKPGYVRVSHVLKKYTSFAYIDPEVLDAKAYLGDCVHAAITDDCQGEFPMLTDKKQVGYYLSFDKWKEKMCPTFYQMEQRYYDDELKLTGEVDAIIRPMRSKDLVLIDYKCSAQANHDYFSRQATLYYHLLQVNGVQVVPYFLWIQLDKNGKLPKVHKYYLTDKMLAECIQDVKNYWKEHKQLDCNSQSN